jgi:hypothetical protein
VGLCCSAGGCAGGAEDALDQAGDPWGGLGGLVDVDTLGQRAAVAVAKLGGDDAGGLLVDGHRRGQRVAEHVRVGVDADRAGEVGEAAAGVVGVERGATLGPEHQIQRHRAGWPAGLDPPQLHSRRLGAGQPQARLQVVVLAQRLHGEGGRLRMALLALDLTGPTASSLRRPDPVWPGSRSASTMVSS